MPSYHDVVVYCGNVEYRIADNYAYKLTCTKTGGWRFWFIWDKVEKLLGGEYDGKPFCITVKGRVICEKKPNWKDIKKPSGAEGWNGVVANG